MTAAHYKGGHHPGNDLGLHYTAVPPIVASCPYSDQLLVTRKFWSPGPNRPSQANDEQAANQLIDRTTVTRNPFDAKYSKVEDADWETCSLVLESGAVKEQLSRGW